MGLDQFIYRTRYNSMSETLTLTPNRNTPPVDPAKVRYITEEVQYWRKVNQIHGWIDRKLNLGDECRVAMTIDDIINLRSDIQLVLDDNSRAQELLPPTPGFFFGGYEIDDRYFGDLSKAAEELDQLILEHNQICEDNDEPRYEYYASW